MKKTAVLIYDSFCNFEFSVLMEIFAINNKSVTIFAKETLPLKSEEGLTILPDKKISELNINEYDSLILTGALDIRKTVEDVQILEFIRKFHENFCVIGAISIAPVLLLKAGILENKKFMAGVNKEEIYEEGFERGSLEKMTDWNENLKKPISEGYIKEGNIITSISYNFIEWSIAVAEELGLNVESKWFGK
jgi:DJ-1/pfpI family protein